MNTRDKLEQDFRILLSSVGTKYFYNENFYDLTYEKYWRRGISIVRVNILNKYGIKYSEE